ncbi:helix-turn-helix transcriptional regulator [Lysinibacillus sp. G4S2]|uniref:helix-turn-helix domain-containing protein n=1 Tax=Lysinibacillus sp. G4S2 TaxID=3055859 RepID=UPI0025A1C84C|nr:helix-turn-helix transcriptional regulator [Lysinibacillus sp. G4S2]MDM5250102.1 helix-turn-helix transcriptional regulator [Lysinibacillus sp. G4S2]
MNENTTTVKGNREISRTFSQRLKHYRQVRNLTYKQLGELAKMDAGYINKLEKGIRRAPSYPIIKNLALSLGVHITDLVDIDPFEEDLPRKSIQEVLVYTEYLIRGKLPTMEARESLSALIQTLLDSEWKEHSKHVDTIKIISKVDIFLKELN